MKVQSTASSHTAFYSGQPVPPGIYRRLDVNHEVILDQAGFLPASIDGRIVAYHSVESYWLSSLRRRMD